MTRNKIPYPTQRLKALVTTLTVVDMVVEEGDTGAYCQHGGGGGGSTNGYSDSKPGQGGAVRIIWGSGRSYPSTLTTDQ